jgi:ABC-type multidrug transport system fused ATPase/permease subunit
MFQRTVQVTIDVQTYFISVERILQYCNIPLEGKSNKNNQQFDTYITGKALYATDKKAITTTSPASYNIILNSSIGNDIFDDNWPHTGNISFHNVYLQYRNNSPVLNGLTFSVHGGQRIGVCGRTGAGTSQHIPYHFISLILTFYIIVCR